MKRQVWFLLIFLLVLGFLLAQSNFWKSETQLTEAERSARPLISKWKDILQRKLQSPTQANDTVPSTKSQAPQPELESWLQSESQKMDSKSYDSVSEESKLRQKAQLLTFEDIEKLKTAAIDMNRSANERILSTYLLSMTSTQGLSALQELAGTQLSNPGEQAPHSLGETLSMHEKALRRMVIDELFKRAQLDPSYVPELARVIEKIPVPELKAYAQARYKQLFGS